MSAATVSLHVKSLQVKQGNAIVLNGITLNVGANEHLLVTGSSGSGKTTLLKALDNRIFYSGSIEWIPAATIAYVPARHTFKTLSNTGDFYYQQRYNSADAEDAITVIEEIQALAVKNGWHVPVERIYESLDFFHLSARINASIIQLSSGEHKRLQLAAALLGDPQVLLLDEPFTGLDIAGKTLLQQLIDQLAADGIKIIIIAASPYMPSCITHVLELHQGAISFYGPKEAYDLQHATTAFAPKQLPFFSNTWQFECAVQMTDVHVQYGGKIIFEHLNWTIRKGEQWLLRGDNGAGKSTLLSLITGDNPQAYSNNINLFDKKRGSGESIWELKRKIGYLSPELHWYFDPKVTVFNTVASGYFDTIGLFKKLNAAQQQQVNAWLEYFGLDDVAQKTLAAVPQGRQRLALLARALVKDPALVILDEPCQGLDELQSKQLIQFIDAYIQQTQNTLIYVTHNPDEIPACITQQFQLKKHTLTA
jgi:molybdate transport system ATP-binding protein